VKQQDFLIEQLKQITHKVPFLLDNAGVSYPPAQDKMKSVFSSPYFDGLKKQMEANPYAEVATPIPSQTLVIIDYIVASWV
jgi:hypothetical protein